MCHTMTFFTPYVILAHIFTSSSLNPEDLSYSSDLVNYSLLLSFFSSIWLLYLYGMNGLSGFTWSGIGRVINFGCHFTKFIFSHPPLIIWLMDLCHHDCPVFIQSNYLIPPLHAALYWDIDRTTWYQELSLVTYQIKYRRRFSRTIDSLPILLMRKRLAIVANYWCNIPVNLFLPSLILLWNVIVYGFDFDWTQRNKSWSILFWSSCCRSCCNISDYRLCALYVVLQWEY